MTDSILARMRRVTASGIDTGLTFVERASGDALMREALRDMDAAIALAEAQHAALLAGVAEAEAETARLSAERHRLDDDVRLALRHARHDLAAALVGRQIDIEAEVDALAQRKRDAAQDAARVTSGIDGLRARRAVMDGGVSSGQGDRPALDLAIERKAAAAETAYARAAVLAGKSPAIGAGTTEIAALRRADLVAERLAAMTAGQEPKEAPKPRRKRG